MWRKQLQIDYDRWRLGHAVLAILALGLALAHIEGVGHFVGAPWKKLLWGLICLTWLLLLAYVRLLKPALQLRRPFRVT